jgi:hypothetical protein
MMEISKESLPNAYATPDNGSSAWKSVRSKWWNVKILWA